MTRTVRVLTVVLLGSVVPNIPAAPVQWSDGNSSARYDDTSQGNAVWGFQPWLSIDRPIGIFVDVRGYDPNLRSPVWPAGINVRHGSASRPVPVGTKGNITCVETNIDSAQKKADQSPGESGHTFGSTVKTSGGATINILDAAREINGVSADTALLNLDLKNNAGGGHQVGCEMQSDGRFPGFAAYSCGGPNNKWLVAVDAARLPIYNTNEIVFSDPPGPAPWTVWADRNQMVFQVNGQVVGWWGADGTLHVKKLVQGQ